MDFKFKKIALIGKRYSSEVKLSQAIFAEVVQFLQKLPIKLYIEQLTAQHLVPNLLPSLSISEIGQNCDAAIVIGGDGTMLGIGCKLANYGIPIIGINHGRLGFITDISLNEYSAVLPNILQGNYDIDYRPILDVNILREQKSIYQTVALNDVVLSRFSVDGMIEVAININQHFVASQRADGMIVSTATGSTAYSLSVGGPLLHPDVDAFVIAPIAAHNLSNRPIVVAQKSNITLELLECNNATASFDSRSFASLQRGDSLNIKDSGIKATFLHPKGWNYFDTLRQKLGWNVHNTR